MPLADIDWNPHGLLWLLWKRRPTRAGVSRFKRSAVFYIYSPCIRNSSEDKVKLNGSTSDSLRYVVICSSTTSALSGFNACLSRGALNLRSKNSNCVQVRMLLKILSAQSWVVPDWQGQSKAREHALPYHRGGASLPMRSFNLGASLALVSFSRHGKGLAQVQWYWLCLQCWCHCSSANAGVPISTDAGVLIGADWCPPLVLAISRWRYDVVSVRQAH